MSTRTTTDDFSFEKRDSTWHHIQQIRWTVTAKDTSLRWIIVSHSNFYKTLAAGLTGSTISRNCLCFPSIGHRRRLFINAIVAWHQQSLGWWIWSRRSALEVSSLCWHIERTPRVRTMFRIDPDSTCTKDPRIHSGRSVYLMIVLWRWSIGSLHSTTRDSRR